MTWFRRLYETYDNCKELSKNSEFKVLPICHSIQKAHIEITIDGEGNFKGAKLLNPSEETIIQVTEDSASRTSSCEPHGLADKIQYIAKDYVNYSGNKGSYFNEYFNQLEQWNNSKYSNPKIKAVYEYVKKGTVVKDLVNCAVVYVDVDRNLRSISDIKDDNKSRLVELNEILKLYIANIKSKEQSIDVESKFEKLKKIKEQIESKFPVINDQGDFFVRWRVNLKGDYQSETWNDESIQKCWIDFVSSQDNTPGICYIYPDKGEAPLASKHPKNIYSGSNGAKIVSANDKVGFTYRGRFEESNQAFGVSFQVSQKAHAVLKFLLSKELGIAYQNGSQAYVAWAQSMEKLPKFCDDSYDLFEEENPEISANISENIGQIFAEKLKKKMYGYSQKLGNADNIMVIGIDSATPGRISVIYYKELKSSDFLKRIESWHKRYSWLQYCSKDKQFYGAASPTDIAKAAYGNQSDDKIVRKT
ncbi:MAG: type I-C CRISPR-associated protein Cas8c/Csd1, partial [Endomicrobium sp.]|nr:type I-C CRISPR-associated protein Cas8c/Csd1 [Endomicrobium sp.]